MQTTITTRFPLAILDKIDSLNKKFTRFNHPTIEVISQTTYKEERKYIVTPHGEKYHPHYVTLTDIEFTYTPFKLNDITVIATIDHIEGLTNVAPNQTLPEQYINASSNCEHCNINHQRNKTIIVQKSNGTYMQLGGNCVAYYLGIDASDVINATIDFYELIAYTEPVDELDDYTHSANNQVQLEHYLYLTAHCITQHGFTPKSKASYSQQSTVDQIKDLQHEMLTTNKSWDFSAHTTLVTNVLEWLKHLDIASTNDYLRNLAHIANNDYVTNKSAGYAASAINSYQNYLKRKAEQTTNNSQFVGNVKQRLQLTLTVDSAKYLESQYGVTTMLSMHDESGNVFVWFASGEHEVDTGEVLTGKATVKKHNIYNGVNQTVITRFTIKN